MVSHAPQVIGDTPGLVAEWFDGHPASTEDTFEKHSCWTIEATVSLDPAAVGGVIAAVAERGVDCVRALVVRRGQLGVLGWAWRGDQALWTTTTWTATPGEWAHVAATHSNVGDLVLYADGQAVRSFAAGGLFPGRQPRQRLTTGPVMFGEEMIPEWRGQLQHIRLYARALTPAAVEQHARVALNVPEPAAPAPFPSQPPDPVGCDDPAHLPAWRADGDRLRCLQCTPPRGCEFDDHQRYWRTVGDDMRLRGFSWRFECAYCLKAASARGEAVA